MSYFYYGVYIPSLDRKLYFKELTICQLKGIIKTILNNDDYALSLCFNAIIKENCMEDITTLSELTIFDRFLILLNMRIVSIGGSQKLQITCDETKMAYSITLDYNHLLNQLEQLNLESSKDIKRGNLNVKFGIPLITQPVSLENNTYSQLVNSIYNVSFGSSIFQFSQLALHESTNIINHFPKDLTDDILKYLSLQENKINGVYFINVENPYTYKQVTQEMSLDNAVLNRILKLAFKEDLNGLYKSIHYMVHVLKYTPEYVENMTMNEKQLYWSYYIADEKEKQKGNKQSKSGMTIRNATQDFLNEM